MKTINKIFSILLATFVIFAFSSCEDDKVEYSMPEKLDSAQVYFPNTNPLEVVLTAADTSFDVIVARVKDEKSESYSLSSTGGGGLYNVPSSVSFAGGEKTAMIKVTFDPEEIEFDDFMDLTIAIESEATPYGIAELTMNVGIAAPWVSLGMATFIEDFTTTFFTTESVPYKVEIQENELQPGLYRLVNPFGKAFPYNEDGDYDTSKDWFFEIDAQDPDGVYFFVQEVGMDWGYGMFSMGSLAGHFISQGSTVEEEKAKGNTGTLKDGVITFPTRTHLIRMANHEGGGLYYANLDGNFRVAMPGVVLADHTLEVSYAGKYTDARDNDIGAIANITEIGVDIEKMHVALIEGNDIDGAIEGMLEGDIDVLEVDPVKLLDPEDEDYEPLSLMLPFVEAPVDGPYAIVVLGLDGDEHVATAVAPFNYTAPGGEKWNLVSTGTYTFQLYWAKNDGSPAPIPGMEIFQSSEDNTRYKIEEWNPIDGSADFYFNYDKTTGKITVPQQEIGSVHSQYGTVYVQDTEGYGSPEIEVEGSYFEDGVFYFDIVYFVGAGFFGEGYETLEITGDALQAQKRHSFDFDFTVYNKSLTKVKTDVKEMNKYVDYRKFK